MFRAVPLRNVDLTAPYFHSGKVWDLEQAVAIVGASQLATDLSDQELCAIDAFLRTLTGEQPRVDLPLLPVSTPSTPNRAPQVKTSLEPEDAVHDQTSVR